MQRGRTIRLSIIGIVFSIMMIGGIIAPSVITQDAYTIRLHVREEFREAYVKNVPSNYSLDTTEKIPSNEEQARDLSCAESAPLQYKNSDGKTIIGIKAIGRSTIIKRDDGTPASICVPFPLNRWSASFLCRKGYYLDDLHTTAGHSWYPGTKQYVTCRRSD